TLGHCLVLQGEAPLSCPGGACIEDARPGASPVLGCRRPAAGTPAKVSPRSPPFHDNTGLFQNTPDLSSLFATGSVRFDLTVIGCNTAGREPWLWPSDRAIS